MIDSIDIVELVNCVYEAVASSILLGCVSLNKKKELNQMLQDPEEVPSARCQPDQ